MQADRSKNRNSSAFACPDRPVALHPVGNGFVGSESSLPLPAGGGASFTWMSVKTTRPHCLSVVVSTGVLIVRYWTERWMAPVAGTYIHCWHVGGVVDCTECWLA